MIKLYLPIISSFLVLFGDLTSARAQAPQSTRANALPEASIKAEPLRMQSQDDIERSCREQAKKIAAENYKSCFDEKQSQLLDKIQKDYEAKLNALKQQYDSELKKLKKLQSVKQGPSVKEVKEKEVTDKESLEINKLSESEITGEEGAAEVKKKSESRKKNKKSENRDKLIGLKFNMKQKNDKKNVSELEKSSENADFEINLKKTSSMKIELPAEIIEKQISQKPSVIEPTQDESELDIPEPISRD